MKRRMLSTIGVGVGALAMALAANSLSYVNNAPQTVKEVKATLSETKKARTKVVNQIGGIPLESYVPNYGMSPKEYGIRFGNGRSRKGKLNLNKLSHNCKVKSRMS
ncbi:MULTISPECIES: hypothetical protein [Olivibacter]|uniref:Uncharacterized protein n=1 Tax=Olivibacter jilunii TaxID=985016 RepID=A0ABW6B161_9SPHI